jgi:hypothetical protein
VWLQAINDKMRRRKEGAFEHIDPVAISGTQTLIFADCDEDSQTLSNGEAFAAGMRPSCTGICSSVHRALSHVNVATANTLP